jgi:mannuronan synthase
MDKVFRRDRASRDPARRDPARRESVEPSLSFDAEDEAPPHRMPGRPESERGDRRRRDRDDPRPEVEEGWTALRNEARNERMHVRVQLPFQVVIDGRRYVGHDISVSGFSTAKQPPVDEGAAVPCDLYIKCTGFRAGIPTTARLLGERDGRGARFEFTEISAAEASILRRLIRAHLAGVHLTFEQLAAKEDAQTVRERVKKTVRPPNPAPSLVRFGATLAAIGVLLLVLGAALYERLFVIEPDFAAVTAPEIRIYAPTDGELAPHELDPGDLVTRDQVLVEVKDPEAEAQLVLAEATLSYNERMLENLRESLESGGSATVVSGGGEDGAPVITELSPLELRSRIKELESTYGFAKAKLRALEARSAAGTVYAPCDCIVHSIRSGAGGYWVQKGALIAQVIRNGAEDVNVEALVHLGEISAIEPNERAEVVMPTTGETHTARVTSIQLESQNIERAGFPEWARQDMSHGSVILAMEDPLPPSLVGHPVEVRFIDTDSVGGEALATVFGTLSDMLYGLIAPFTVAEASDAGANGH